MVHTMDLAPHLASLRAAAGLARLSIGETRADGFAVVRHTKRGDVDGDITFTVERPQRTPTMRLRTGVDDGLDGLVLRITREQTPRGVGRKYRELVVGEKDIDEAWVLEGSASLKDRVLGARDALVLLRAYDAEMTFDRGTMSAAVRTSEGRRALEIDTVSEALTGLIAVWRAFGAPEGVAAPVSEGDEHKRAEALESVRADIVAAVALFAGDVHRVGDAWHARVSLALAGEVELHATVRVTPAKDVVVVELEGAVSPEAKPARIARKRGIVGGEVAVVDVDEPLSSASAVRTLANARRIDAIVAPAPSGNEGRIQVRVEVDRSEEGAVRATIAAALELWRAVHVHTG